MKLKDVEIKAGMTPGTIKNWKSFFPPANVLGKVAIVLRTSVDYLLGATDCTLPIHTIYNPATTIILKTLEGKDLTVDSAMAVKSSIEAIAKLQDTLLDDIISDVN